MLMLMLMLILVLLLILLRILVLIHVLLFSQVIDKALRDTEGDIQSFQLEKQRKLNELLVVLTLQMNQAATLDTCHCTCNYTCDYTCGYTCDYNLNYAYNHTQSCESSDAADEPGRHSEHLKRQFEYEYEYKH